jgi:hypothetical protein
MSIDGAQRASPQWLQNLKAGATSMSELRRSVACHDLGLDLSRLDDSEVILQFTNLLDQKMLRPCGDIKGGAAGMQAPERNRSQNAAEKIAQTLTEVHKPWSLEGQMLLIIRADQWRRLRDDGQYQIVPIAEARRMIPRLAAMPAIKATEKESWEKAVDFLAEPGRGRFDTGLLLVRIVPRRTFKSPSTEPPITPSQFAKLVAEPVIEKVNPEIVADLHQLDTADDGFVPEEEPSGDEEEGSAAAESSDDTNNGDE